MTPSRNRFLARFTNDGLDAPTEWTSKQALRLYEVGMETEQTGEWFGHAVSGTIKIALQPPVPEMSPYGTDPEMARRHALKQASLLREKADLIEATLNAYGPGAFIVKSEAVECPPQPAMAEPFLLSILRQPWTNIWINGIKFCRGSSGAVSRAQTS